MDLSLEETATRLGKSPRQVRYLIKEGRLAARKFLGRWVIAADALPLSPGQISANDRKKKQLRAAVDRALELTEPPARRYSLSDLKAFQIALPLHRTLVERLGVDHPATQQASRSLRALAVDCHRFDASEKASAYREARDAASLIVCELLTSRAGQDEDLVAAVLALPTG